MVSGMVTGRSDMDTAAFPESLALHFAHELRSSWRSIYEEFLSKQNELEAYIETGLYNRGWEVLALWNLPHRESLPEATKRFPLTATLLERLVPTHGAVAFSVLAPGTHIRPHTGRAGPYLRCHLGLEVPQGDCGLRVGSETRSWIAGELLVFDDRLEHEAWNRTSQRRVVLLFDFIP